MKRNQLAIWIITAIAVALTLYLWLRDSNAPHLNAEEAALLQIEYCGDTEVCPDIKKQGGLVWCPPDPQCFVFGTDTCDCTLYRDKKGDEGREWERYGKSNEKKDYDPNAYNYACWCTKK
jgi:hypothetical protein